MSKRMIVKGTLNLRIKGRTTISATTKVLDLIMMKASIQRFYMMRVKKSLRGSSLQKMKKRLFRRLLLRVKESYKRNLLKRRRKRMI